MFCLVVTQNLMYRLDSSAIILALEKIITINNFMDTNEDIRWTPLLLPLLLAAVQFTSVTIFSLIPDFCKNTLLSDYCTIRCVITRCFKNQIIKTLEQIASFVFCDIIFYT